MPQILMMLLSMLGGEAVRKGGSVLLRKLAGDAGKSVTQRLAAGAAAKAAGSMPGRMIDSGLSSVAGHLPAWAGKRLGVEPLVRNATQLGGMAGQMGLFMGGSLLAEEALGLLGGRGDEKTISGWESFQGQSNPGVRDNMLALGAIEQDAQMKHLARALQEALAAQQENDRRYGGLF
jgi:hypothetical protein